MIRMVSRATLFLALGLLVASAAMAGVPNAANSTGVTGGILRLGSVSGATLHASVERVITVRDAANNPVANSVVVINLNACYAGEIRLANVQPFAGLTLNCGARSVSAVTNSSGIAVFRIHGASNVGASSAPGIGEGCASVTADGVPLGSMSVATADVNGSGGVSGPDYTQFSQALTDAASCNPCYRSRVNFSTAGDPPGGDINGPDYTEFSKQLIFGGASAAGYCP